MRPMSASNTPLSCSRRQFFRGVALASAATASGALLAACAGDKVVAKAAKADIPLGDATIIDGWIISHPTESEYTAFSTVCPHANGTIDKIEDFEGTTVATCPKHGSRFDVATGDVVEGPSRDPLTAAKSVSTNGDSVEVSD